MIRAIPRIGKLGKVGAKKPTPPIEPLTGGGVQQLDLIPKELKDIIRLIGEKRAKRVWKLIQKGIVATLPEYCTYDWLDSRPWLRWEYQSEQMGGRRVMGGAVVDFIIYNLDARGVVIWRVQGEYWHSMPETVRKDAHQRARLLQMRVDSIPIVRVTDLWEDDIYHRYPDVFELAEVGIGLRG